MKTSRWTALLHNQAVALVLLMLFAVPALFGAPAARRGDQVLVYGFLGLALLVVWALRAQGSLTWERVRTYALSGPNLAITGFVAWNAVSAALSTEPLYTQWAMVQLVCGVVLYGLVTYQFRHRDQVKALLASVLVVGVVVVLAALMLDGQRGLKNLAGSFRDRQLFGAFLTMLFPVTLGIAAGTRNRVWKMAAQISCVLILGALLLTECRSSWLGTIVGTMVFFLLGIGYAWKLGKLSARKHELILTPALGIVALAIFLSFSGATGQVVSRMGTVSSLAKIQGDDSVKDRRDTLWAGGLREVVAKSPIIGHGPGTYAVKQADAVPGSRPEMLVRAMGTSLFDNPHNLYLNLLGDTGYVGLAFYLAILVCFYGAAIRALPKLENGLRKFTLIGSMASMAALSVDAFANPGYVYPEVTSFFWVILGLGMCAAGLGQRVQDTPREGGQTETAPRAFAFVGRGVRTALVGCGALWVGALLWSLHTASPAAAGGPPRPGGGSGGGQPTYAGVMTGIDVDLLHDQIGPEEAFDINNATIYCDRSLYFHVFAYADQKDQNANVTFEKKFFKFKLLDGLKGKIGFTQADNNPRFFFRPAKASCGRSGRVLVKYPTKSGGSYETEFQVNVLGDAPFYAE
jgi:putative inorganic carbon (HCO3(-)) transporter